MLSPKAAGLAAKNGYRNLKVNREGEPGWRKAEYPLEVSPEFVKDGNLVLVDLRSPEAAAQGFLPRAVNIPAAQLKGAEAQFPQYRGAALVFYSDNPSEVTAALELARDWEYTNATRFPDAIATWKKRGWELGTGAPSTTISYVKKVGPNEVSTADFLKAVEDGSALIVDARAADEYQKGHFRGAVNVPAEEAAKRLAELPKDRPAYVHCTTGSRAEMLFDIAAGAGYKNMKLLKANVSFSGDGAHKVTD